MEKLAITVRAARADDALAIARVYVDSWHDTYPAILPAELLRAMNPKGQAQRWRAAILAPGRERILVAECPRDGILGMTSFGAAQDKAVGFDGEIYTLYVAPDFFGKGIGKSLFTAAFGALHGLRFSSCIIWAHARNPARFFYEAMGGRLVAERSRPMMRTQVPEVAFGWPRLSLAEGSTRSRGKVNR